MLTIDDVKDYLRVDSDIEDDAQIAALITAAKEYIVNQTGKQYQDDMEVWNIAIKLLVAHWYENREITPSKSATLAEYPHSVSSIINHISLCSAYPYIAGMDGGQI